ncbi:MAG TPA: S1C family serine protease [Pirellulales bacterium]|nr:S1C family serine protease [Pirellulales bacterium]
MTKSSLLLICLALATACAPAAAAGRAEAGDASLGQTVAQVEPKIVKIYGAGGYRGLEAYQSGFLISAEGHILTVWSYVLDTDYITATLNDGSRYDAKLLAADPRLELAVLKIEARDLPHFDLHAAADGPAGSRVLAFSNLFGVATGDEPASVQHGVISVRTRLDARRGAYETPYKGPIYVLDAMTNNPGAAGGALTDVRGRLLGMLGKELRSRVSNIWLNYALPIEEMTKTVDSILAGKYVKRAADEREVKPQHAWSARRLGLVLVPDVLERTPPYIDEVRAGSAAEAAGLRPDDLVIFIGDRLVASCKAVTSELERLDRADPVKLTVSRENDLVEITLPAEAREVKSEK